MPFSKRGTCLTPLQSQEMLDIYHGGVFRSADWNHTGRITVAPQQIALDYVEDLAKLRAPVPPTPVEWLPELSVLLIMAALAAAAWSMERINHKAA